MIQTCYKFRMCNPKFVQTEHFFKFVASLYGANVANTNLLQTRFFDFTFSPSIFSVVGWGLWDRFRVSTASAAALLSASGLLHITLHRGWMMTTMMTTNKKSFISHPHRHLRNQKSYRGRGVRHQTTTIGLIFVAITKDCSLTSSFLRRGEIGLGVIFSSLK